MHLAGQRGRNHVRDRVIGVELPVRVVAREEKQLVRAHLLHELLKGFGRGGTVERLRRQAHLITHDLERRTVYPGDFHPQPLPELVEVPDVRGQPRHARLDQHHAQLGKLGEHAFADEARELRLEGERLVDVVLGVIGGPADRRGRVPEAAAGVDADGQPVPRRGRIDRPVVAAPERRLAADQHQHLHEALVVGPMLDLVDAAFDALHRQHDRAPEAGITIEPLARQPRVQTAAQAGRKILVEKRLHAIERIADGKPGVPAVENLCAHDVDVGGSLAGLRTPVGPRRQRRARRIVPGFEIRQARLVDDFRPVLGKMRDEALHPGNGGMDIAVDGARQWFRHARLLHLRRTSTLEHVVHVCCLSKRHRSSRSARRIGAREESRSRRRPPLASLRLFDQDCTSMLFLQSIPRAILGRLLCRKSAADTSLLQCKMQMRGWSARCETRETR